MGYNYSFKIENAKLGSVFFGTVYRGMCRGKEVAVKVLRQSTLDDKTVNEFKREVQIMSTLKIQFTFIYGCMYSTWKIKNW